MISLQENLVAFLSLEISLPILFITFRLGDSKNNRNLSFTSFIFLITRDFWGIEGVEIRKDGTVDGHRKKIILILLPS